MGSYDGPMKNATATVISGNDRHPLAVRTPDGEFILDTVAHGIDITSFVEVGAVVNVRYHPDDQFARYVSILRYAEKPVAPLAFGAHGFGAILTGGM